MGKALSGTSVNLVEHSRGLSESHSNYKECISSGLAVNTHSTPKAYQFAKSERDYNKKKSRVAKISLGSDAQFRTMNDSRETLENLPAKFHVPNR